MNEQTADLFEQQQKLENEALNFGIDRYFRNKNRLEDQGEAGAHNPHKRLIEDAVAPVAQNIREWLDQYNGKGRGRKPEALRFLNAMEPERVAVIGLWAAFSAVASQSDLRSAQIKIGEQITEDIWLSTLETQDPKAFEKIKDIALRNEERKDSRSNAVNKMAKKQNLPSQEAVEEELGLPAGRKKTPEQTDLRKDVMIKVGMPVLNAVLKDSGVVERVTKDERELLALTEKASQRVLQDDTQASVMAPMYEPMVVPPKKWESFHTGAYLTENLNTTVKLVKTFDREHRKLIGKHIAEGRMEPCLTALNTIQEVPYMIDSFIKELAKWTHDQNYGLILDKLPQKNRMANPKTVRNLTVIFTDGATASLVVDNKTRQPLSKATIKYRTIQQKKTGMANRSITGENMVIQQDFQTADKMEQYEEFFLPSNMDYRGRVYCIPHFNHQRADHINAMIIFARGKPVGQQGGYWLAVHCANVGDFGKVSKKSFQDRINWVWQNAAMIRRIARNPYETVEEWAEADKPFQFVQACREMDGFWTHGGAWISHVPVALDGSNSGLQHYSAALRSREEGRRVCLTDETEPADVYQEVADEVAKEVEQDVQKSQETLTAEFVEATEKPKKQEQEEFEAEMAEKARKTLEAAQRWHTWGVGRKVVKRNVMTFCYSSEQYGFKQQIKADFMKPIAEEVLGGSRSSHPFDIEGDEGAFCAGYLAKKVWGAVNRMVPRAAEAMKWLKKSAQALAHESKPVLWSTPVGFPVLHKNMEWEDQKVKLHLYDQRVSVSEATTNDKVTQDGDVYRTLQSRVRTKPTGTLNKSKQGSAVSPNVIHSMDASHLMKVVLQAREEGITDIQLIHDSFATHAADTGRFFEIIRETFAEQYENLDLFSYLADLFHSQLTEEGREKLPETPGKGDLDLTEVLQSSYAFA
jgi:DNA-directed RNA polymerase